MLRDSSSCSLVRSRVQVLDRALVAFHSEATSLEGLITSSKGLALIRRLLVSLRSNHQLASYIPGAALVQINSRSRKELMPADNLTGVTRAQKESLSLSNTWQLLKAPPRVLTSPFTDPRRSARSEFEIVSSA